MQAGNGAVAASGLLQFLQSFTGSWGIAKEAVGGKKQI
jgi:hypothetical protein